MSTERDRIITAVRRALGRDGPEDAEAVHSDYAAGLGGPNPRPAWHEDRIDRFTERLDKAAATWERVGAPDDAPEAIARYLEGEETPALQLAPDPALTDIAWPAAWTIRNGLEGASDAHVGVAMAYAGIADTGSLVMPSAPERPTTLNFLPDIHILLLRAEHVVDYMEDVWERLLSDFGQLPRTVNVITGPSRTADVEQTLQLGAHGPRRLHVLILGRPDASPPQGG